LTRSHVHEFSHVHDHRHSGTLPADLEHFAAAQRYMLARYGSQAALANSASCNWYAQGGGGLPGGNSGAGGSPVSVPAGGGNGGSSPGLPPSRGVSSQDGFSEEAGPPLVAGFHTGYRWWYLPAPDLSRSPADADEWWDPDWKNLLHGQRAPWVPGVNTAACLNDARYTTGQPHDPETIPDATCGCGFWAYWQLQHRQVGSQNSTIPVCGVIKGWGRTRRGPLGFRCVKARILAVTLPSPVVPVIGSQSRSGWRLAFPDVREAGDGGRVIVLSGKTGYDLNGPEIRAALSHAEAWTAVIGDRIEQMYPGVRVFQSVNAMRAVFPPDPEYPQPACPACGAQGPESAGAHLAACQSRFWQPGAGPAGG